MTDLDFTPEPPATVEVSVTGAPAPPFADAQSAHDASTVALAEAKRVCLDACSGVHVERDENGLPTPESLAADKAAHDPHRAALEAAYARFDETAVALAKLSNGRVGAE